jgi:hypothetical protein
VSLQQMRHPLWKTAIQWVGFRSIANGVFAKQFDGAMRMQKKEMMHMSNAKHRPLRVAFLSVCALCALMTGPQSMEERSITQSVTAHAETDAFVSPPFRYGKHYPNGDDAVSYIYSEH